MRTSPVLLLLVLAGCTPVGAKQTAERVPRAVPHQADTIGHVPSLPKRPSSPPPTPKEPARETQEMRVPEPVANLSPPRPRRPPLLVTPEQEALYFRFWPKSDSVFLKELRDDPDLFFYDEESIPRIYQVWDAGAGSGLVRVDSGVQTANQEFPWRDPAGLRPESNFKTIRFARISEPVTIHRTQRSGIFAGFDWVYPPETVFGEILLVTRPDGYDHTFELRTRRRKPSGSWSVNAFRPFPTEDSLRLALASRGFDFSPSPAEFLRIGSNHQRNAFNDQGFAVQPPAMSTDLVRDLLKETKFTGARGRQWRDDEEAPVMAPTSQAAFSIVPRGYMGEFLPVDGKFCMRCHKDAGKVVNLAGDERWRLRGGDAIFSFHPFDPSAIGRGVLPRLNPKLVQAGLIARAP